MSNTNRPYDASKDWQGASAYAPYIKETNARSLESLEAAAAKLYGENDRVGGQAYAAGRSIR